MTKEQLQEAIALNKSKVSMLEKWLHDHFENPYRVKVLRDLDSVRIELRTKEFNLDQLLSGLPSHGEAIPEPSNDLPQNTKTKNI